MATRIKVGDQVVVTAGKDKGKRGRVMRILKDEDRVLVEGVNTIVRHRRRNPQNPNEGGRSESEGPIHVSNVMPWSDKDGKGVRVRMGEEKGKKIRLSTSGAKIVASTAAQADAAEGGAKKKSTKKKKKQGGED